MEWLHLGLPFAFAFASSISVTNISVSHCSKFIVSVRFCHPVEGAARKS